MIEGDKIMSDNQFKVMTFPALDVSVKDYGYKIVKVDDNSVFIITNDFIKEEFKKAFPWAKTRSEKFKKKKFIRDPNPEGFYWNYKNAKAALKYHYRMLHMFSRKEGMDKYYEEFKKYKIVKISDHKIGLHKKLDICLSLNAKAYLDDFAGYTLSTTKIANENL